MNKLSSLCHHIQFESQALPKDELGEVHSNIEILFTWIRENPNAKEQEYISRYNTLKNNSLSMLSNSTNEYANEKQTSASPSKIEKMTYQFYLTQGKELLKTNTTVRTTYE